MASSERFGYEWQKYDFLLPAYEEQFLKWVHPLGKEFFRGKTILDAGCGMGRNSYWCLTYGAKKVVAFDYDKRSVSAAAVNLAPFPNASVTKGDIYNFKPGEQFDLVFSIGVIHHLRDPRKALANLASLVRPGGIFLIWVYGYEGNEWIVRFVNPVRKLFTSRLPVSIVHVLSYLCSLPLFLVVRMLPAKNAYLKQLKDFSFQHIHSIVFDQLIPEVANYWTRDEVAGLLRGTPGIEHFEIYPVNGMSWTAIATKESEEHTTHA